jgi:hypothetical protein
MGTLLHILALGTLWQKVGSIAGESGYSIGGSFEGAIVRGAGAGALVGMKSLTRVEGTAFEDRRREERDRMTRRVLLNV